MTGRTSRVSVPSFMEVLSRPFPSRLWSTGALPSAPITRPPRYYGAIRLPRPFGPALPQGLPLPLLGLPAGFPVQQDPSSPRWGGRRVSQGRHENPIPAFPPHARRCGSPRWFPQTGSGSPFCSGAGYRFVFLEPANSPAPPLWWAPCAGALRTRSFLLRLALCYGLLAVSALVRLSWLPGATLTTNPGVLYHDLTCTYCEWRDDDLITFGYPRDRVEGAPQVNWGMIVTPEGLPITVQVYPGNTKDETTVTGMRERLEKVFGLHGGVYVGDRGMRTKDNLSESNVAREVVTANGVRHVVLLNERRR